MSEVEQSEQRKCQKPDWTAKVVAISSIFVPLVIAGIGAWYNISMKDSENRVRYVELAIEQLRALPTPETTALREWAVSLLDSQAPVKLSDEAKHQLMSTPLAIHLSGSAVADAESKATLSVK